MAPILKLVLFRAQSQHSLRVGVKLIMEVVQQGGPRPVLKEKRVGIMELAQRTEVCPLPGGSRHLATSTPVPVWTCGLAGSMLTNTAVATTAL